MVAGTATAKISKCIARVSPNEGVVSGGVTIADGAMVFDGDDGKVTTSSDVGIGSGPAPFSISTWAYLKPNGVTQTLIDTGDNNAVIRTRIQINADNKVSFTIRESGASTKNLLSDVVSEGWYFIALTSNGSIARPYLNTIPLSTLSHTLAIVSSTRKFDFGRNYDNTAWFNGSLDDTLIFNRALSQAEITTLYNQGRGQYSPYPSVVQYNGRDYLGTALLPTKIYDMKNSTGNIPEVDVEKLRVTSNDKWLMCATGELKNGILPVHIEEDP